jgi:hypothetical protein
MSRIEIKQRKKIVVPFLLFGAIIIISTGLGIFLLEKYKDDTSKKISFLVGIAIFLYFLYSPVRKLVKNQPIIILEKDSIILNTNKCVIIKAKEIESISVTYIEESGEFLRIKTKDNTHETNISWLDKTPNEIRDLIKVYAK